MLADFLTMHEASGKPTTLAYAFVGDCQFNMGRSCSSWALMGADVRLAGPKALWPPDDVVALAQQAASSTSGSPSPTTPPRR
jgi:ornithine carbamoyltransferase